MELASSRVRLSFGDPWVDRVSAIVRDSDKPVWIECEAHSGILRVLESLCSVDRPLLWIDYRAERSIPMDEGSMASCFVDSVNRATSSRVFAPGMSLRVATAAFSKLHTLLGPFVIGVAGLNQQPEHLREILALHGARTIVVIIRSCSPELGLVDGLALSEFELSVSETEAIWFGDGRLPDEDVLALRDLTQASYVPFVDAIRRRLGRPPLAPLPQDGIVAGAASEFGLDPEVLTEALIRKKLYVEALELMCAKVPELIPRFVDVCGDAFFERGLFSRLWNLLGGLLPSQRDSDSVMRWYHAAAMAVNRHSEVVPAVEAYLRHREAPELRAQYAASRPSRQFLQETTRALGSLESPITLRHHAFALSLAGQHVAAFDVLQRSLRLADVLGHDQVLIAIATDMCTLLQRNGAFVESLWWGEWACSEYVRRDLRDNYRRVSGLAALAFSKMLVGDEIGLRELIQEIEVSTSLLGVPSYEGVVSTVADYLSIHGNLDSAVELYQMLFVTSAYDLSGMVAIDLVRCLIDRGQESDAFDVAERVSVLSRAASRYQSDCALLARGVALRAVGDERAREVLSDAIEAFLSGSDAVRLCQASIHLALLDLSEGNEDAARKTLLRAGAPLLSLGRTGWRLLGGSIALVDACRDLTTGSQTGLTLNVLGDAEFMLNAAPCNLTGRQQEILAVLAAAATGLSLEGLADKVYGERAVLGTAKAAISRLRSAVPLDSRPYRIGVPFRADFLELMEHLKRGRVRQALSLYRGPLLPGSEAPAIVEMREHIDESLRQAVLASGDAEAMLELANRTDAGDLELLETAYGHLPRNDPQSPLLRARIRQMQRDWGSEDGSTPPAAW